MQPEDVQTPEPAEPQASLADRMYPNEAKQDKPYTPNADTNDPVQARRERARVQAGEPVEPTRSDSTTVDDLVGREQSMADRMFADGATHPDSPQGYDHTLGEAFDALSQDARYDDNEEDAAAVAEGRRETAALLHELQVPKGEAGQLVRTLRDWHGKAPKDQDALWDSKATTIDTLTKEWGKDATARVELAQRTAREACKRLPWLADLLASGAGNDPKLIKQFAEIGLRQARRQRAQRLPK